MATKISRRLSAMVDALPIKEGMRILEIGCGPGVAAREIVNRFRKVYVLAIDRSAKAIDQAIKRSKEEIATGKLRFIQSKVEEFELPKEEKAFDMAFAVRVGALDGRHPEIEKEALRRISLVLKRNGRLFIDGEEVLLK